MQHGAVRCLSPAGFHRMAYVQWGPAGRDDPIICVHGLTRNARDFDRLAVTLSESRRVICPDVVGRGQSAWLADPAHYLPSQYTVDMTVLMAAAGAAKVDWVGTSMGGLVGLMLAAMPNSPIKKLVLNDVGAFLSASALAGLVTGMPAFTYEDRPSAEAGVRQSVSQFGPLTDADLHHLFTHGLVAEAGGRYHRTVDPGILTPMRAAPPQDVDLWALWERVRCPVLLIRGEASTVLTPQTADRMARTGPRAHLWEAKGCGHAPSLMSADQIAVVRSFLDDG